MVGTYITHDFEHISERTVHELVPNAKATDDKTYLKATKTVRTFGAVAPKTLRKKSEATVTPVLVISSLDAALHAYN